MFAGEQIVSALSSRAWKEEISSIGTAVGSGRRRPPRREARAIETATAAAIDEEEGVVVVAVVEVVEVVVEVVMWVKSEVFRRDEGVFASGGCCNCPR